MRLGLLQSGTGNQPNAVCEEQAVSAEIFWDGNTVTYSDTFWDQTMDGPAPIWKQMFAYAKEHGGKVKVGTIHFEKVYSPMKGNEDEVVGFRMVGEIQL